MIVIRDRDSWIVDPIVDRFVDRGSVDRGPCSGRGGSWIGSEALDRGSWIRGSWIVDRGFGSWKSWINMLKILRRKQTKDLFLASEFTWISFDYDRWLDSL